MVSSSEGIEYDGVRYFFGPINFFTGATFIERDWHNAIKMIFKDYPATSNIIIVQRGIGVFYKAGNMHSHGTTVCNSEFILAELAEKFGPSGEWVAFAE